MAARHVVPGSEKRGAPGAQRVGPADPAEVAEVTVVLRLPPGVGEAELAQKAGGRAGAKAGERLTREEFEERFSADPDDVIKVEQFAHAHGLDVVEVNPERRSVVLSGKVAALSAAFGVQLAVDRGCAKEIRQGGRKYPAGPHPEHCPRIGWLADRMDARLRSTFSHGRRRRRKC